MGVFSPVGSAKITLDKVGADSPTIYNIALTANTEIGISLPVETTQYLLKLRDASAKLQVAFVSGDSGSLYLTVPRGNFYADSNLKTVSTTIYCQTPETGQVLELLVWV